MTDFHHHVVPISTLSRDPGDWWEHMYSAGECGFCTQPLRKSSLFRSWKKRFPTIPGNLSSS